MGIKMTRAQLEQAAGRKPTPASPAAAPAAPAPPSRLEEKLDQLAEQLERNTAVMAKSALLIAEPKPEQKKKLEAIIHRDKDGKMARVEINVL